MTNVYIEQIKRSIVNAYIRQSGYRLSIFRCREILSNTSFFTFDKREDQMLGYTHYTLKNGEILTEIHYEAHDSLVKTAMILTHEIGHAIVVGEPIIEKDKILYSKRALLEDREGRETGSYLTEGFLEEMSFQIWQDPIFRLDLKQIGIEDFYEYKDSRIFPQKSYYEEYRTLYRLSNLLLKNSLFLDAFGKDLHLVQKELPISYNKWDTLYREASESLEVLFREEVRRSATIPYYFEDYFYKKDCLCEMLKEIFSLKESEYTEEEKAAIEREFNLYIQNIEALSSLPFTEEQRRKYHIALPPKEENLYQILEEMPKVELHLHLDGSVRKQTMEDILHKKIEEEEVSVVKKEDLNAYLTKFSLPVICMQTKENIERIARELAEDLQKENVIYAEIRFAPFKHLQKGLTAEEVVESALKGLHNVPEVQTRLILCTMRGDSLEQNKKVVDLAFSYLKKGVVAIDLAGAEALFPTSAYEEVFVYAREKNVPFTIHAGEASGADSIEAAIRFGAHRIGHGIRIVEDAKLLKLAEKEDILFEVCPTSNTQTLPTLAYSMHPIYEMYKKGLHVCINTDNRTVSSLSLTEEYMLLLENFPFTIEDFIQMNEWAIAGAFVGEIEKERLREKLHGK